MKKISIALLTVMMFVITSCNNTKKEDYSVSNSPRHDHPIFEKGEKIDSPNFIGTAYLNNLIVADSQNQNAVGCVTFEQGARTRWHSHPAGQIILALDGVGYYQEEGKPIEIIQKGEVVKCPHNIPHWHGASPDSEFVQVAITGRENGPTVWLKPVTDEEYNSCCEKSK